MNLDPSKRKPATSDGSGQRAQTDRSHEVLVALRRIIRAADLHSKRLLKESGLTTPQVLVLQSILDLGEVTTGQISNRMHLSQGTVTTILDRLEARGLVERYRSTSDRRVVHTRLTKDGRSVLKKAPSPLHERFVAKFSELSPTKQGQIIKVLDNIAHMMGAAHLEADPILDVRPPPSAKPPSTSS